MNTAPAAPQEGASADELRHAMAALEGLRGQVHDEALDIAQSALQERLEQLGSGMAAERQLRQVTVMFVDVVGSTAIAGALDPESVQALMDTSLQRFSECVSRHGGRVLQYAGDSVLAAFGTQEAREDDAECAVLAGLDILAEAQRSALSLQEQHHITGFNARVGLHTGPVLLGGGVDGENSIRGVTVSIAARMEQSAPPGELRISSSTWRLVRGLFELEAQAPLLVKGSDCPFDTALVKRRRPRHLALRERGIAGLETPLVGREAELAQLDAAWSQLHTPSPPGAQAWVLLAEPGLGKTRLVNHWLSSRASTSRCTWLHARALPDSAARPQALLRALLLDALGLQDSDADSHGLKERFAAAAALRLRQSDGHDDLAAVHLLGHWLGLDFSRSSHVKALSQDGAQMRSRAQQAACALLRALAQQQPLLVILEDLHWCDAGSLAFWPLLLRACSGERLLWLATARPELLLSHPKAAGATTQVLEMQPLEEEANRALAQALLAPLQPPVPELVDRLTQRAGGNPFYMEEWVQMLRDSGALVNAPAPGIANPEDAQLHWAWHPERQPPAATLPTALTDVLQARMDLLSPEAAQALQAAALAGLEFLPALWAAIEVDAPQQLQALTERGFLRAQGDGLRFGHALMQQAAYTRVLKPQRLAGHGRAASWWAERGRNQPSGESLIQAADHWERAESADACARYSLLAAQWLEPRYAHGDVQRQSERALRSLTSGDHSARWDALLLQQRASRLLGKPEVQAQALQALDKLAQSQERADWQAVVALRQAAAQDEGGRPDLAVALAKDALLRAQALQDIGLQLAAYNVCASAARSAGQHTASLQTAREGLALARQQQLSLSEAELLVSLAATEAELGHNADSQRHLEQALVLHQDVGNLLGQCSAHLNLGTNALQWGELDAAQHHFDEALGLSQRLGRRQMECGVWLNRSALALAKAMSARDASGVLPQDAAQQAAISAEQALAIAQQDGNAEMQAFAHLSLGAALEQLHSDAPQAALVQFGAGAQALQDMGLEHLATEAWAGQARCHWALGDAEAARARLESILVSPARTRAFAGTERPVLLLHSCFKLLKALGDARALDLGREARVALSKLADQAPHEQARQRLLITPDAHAELWALEA